MFASELKALIKTEMMVEQTGSDISLPFLYIFSTSHRTPLKNLRSLLPGHYLTYNPNNKNIELFEYWDVPLFG